MIPLSITTNIEHHPWSDAADVTTIGVITRIGRLPRGVAEGRSTVAIMIEMPDGTRVIGQTTLRLMQNAMAAFKGAEDAGL